MARQRSRERAGSGTTNVTTNERKGIMAVGVEIADDKLAELLASSKQRGEYTREFGNFLSAEVKAWQIPLDSGTFAGKKAQSVKTGFENARKKAEAAEATAEVAGVTRVVLNEDQVYLIRTDLVG